MPGLVKVLSIDGGGVRGAIPAVVLAEIERRTGAPICRLFDVIAGTSTGGILALGLTKPDAAGQPQYSARRLAELYASEAAEIFARPLAHRLRAAGSLFEEKYPASGLETVLRRHLGDARLSDALADVLVTAYEIELRSAFFFRSSRARERPDYDFPMREVARATSAAPTYFEPAKLDSRGSSEKPYWALVDGGVFANNPAMCGLVEATTRHRARGGETPDVLLVSLGTGHVAQGYPYEKARGWGRMDWPRPLLGVVFDGIADTVEFQASELACASEGPPERYFRFQTLLAGANDAFDDASAANVAALRRLAEEMVERESAKLDRLARELAPSPP